jgi:hypothetical protein
MKGLYAGQREDSISIRRFSPMDLD